VRYLEENAHSLEVTLSEDDLAKIEAAFPYGAAAGTRYPEASMAAVNR
jgi:aryl-alcohol dehydrogenase-like predicted oxidoreductase